MKTFISYEVVIAGALALFIAASSSADTILIDFGATSAPGPTTGQSKFWNNITTGMGFTVAAGTNFGPGAFLDLTNTAGVPSGVTITVLRSFALQNQNGIATGITNQFGDVYPGTATGDSLYGNRENFNGTSNVFPALNLSGLNPSTIYTFKFYGSRQSNDRRDTRYSLTGVTNNFADLNPGQNGITNVVRVTMTPDAGGNILYEQTNSPANTQANHFTYLGIMQIDYGARLATTVSLNSSENPSAYGDSIIFTAGVQTNSVVAANVTGSIIFKINSIAVSTNVLSGGTATITNSTMPSGTNIITAAYMSDGQYLGSTNNLAGGQVVVGIPTTITTSPTASTISYGQTLAGSILSGGSASVGGSFNFTMASITPNAGATNVSVTFTPDNPGYAPATTNVTVSVSKTSPSLSPKAGTVIDGQTLASSSLSGSAATNSFNSAPVAGSFVFITPSVTPHLGLTNVSLAFLPVDTANYNSATTTVTVMVVDKLIRIAVVGSSTAQGFGPTDYAHAWVGLYTAYLASINPSNSVANLAVGGYTTYDTLPTGTINPGNRPTVKTTNNITAALATHPDAVLINLPSNDANAGYSEAETETNFLIMAAVCQASNVPVWISTTQPRDSFGGNVAIGRTNLMDVRAWIISTFPASYLDFWTSIANADGSINAAYGYGDGVHLNNAGHQILYTRVVEARVYELLSAWRTLVLLPAVSGTVNVGFDTITNLDYELQSSTNLLNWQIVTNIPGHNDFASLNISNTNSIFFYRLRLDPVP